MYDPEENFWKNIYTTEDAMRKIVWNATPETFNDNTPEEAQFIKEHLDIQPEDIVLDYGAGIGRLAKAISPSCKQLIGLDVSNSMVCNSHKYLEGVQNVQIFQCDGLGRSGIKANCIDKLYSFIVLQHVDKKKVFFILKHLKQLMSPGGTALIQLPDLLANADTWPVYAQDYVNHNDKEIAAMHMWTEEEARFIFALAGWKVIDVIRKPHNVGQGKQSDFWVKAE